MALKPEQVVDEQALRFVKSFVQHSDQHRRQLGLYESWMTGLQNYLVQPEYGATLSSTAYPLGASHLRRQTRGMPGDRTPIAGSETRELVDVITAKLMLAMFGGVRDFVVAKKRGREDAKAAETVSRLQKYVFGLPGHYMNLATAVKDSVLFGTGMLFGCWHYQRGIISKYEVERLGGMESPVRTDSEGAVYDDIKLRRMDPIDFYPSPGHDLITDMPGVARRFSMLPSEALAYAKRGKYGFDLQKVKEAIRKGPKGDYDKQADDNWRTDRTTNEKVNPDFKQMFGLEYWGECPFMPDGSDRQWGVITLLNDVIVRFIPWPLPSRELPFYDIRHSIMGGRFWGMSPAEAVRYQQDAANALMMLMMDGTVRQIHPPVVFNRNDEIDRSALRAWRPDTPIASDSPQDIRTLQYGANLPAGWNFRNALQSEIQKNSGALGVVAGYGMPFARTSAAEFQGSIQAASDRPEAMAQMIEKEGLARLGKGVLRFYQEFMTDSEALTLRVGERPEAVNLEEIMADFDVEFVGSRNQVSVQARLAAFDRVMIMAQDPKVGPRIDWDDIIAQFLEDNGYDKAAQEIGDPEVVFENILMSRVQGAGAGRGQVALPGQETSINQGGGMPLPEMGASNGMVEEA